MVGRGCCRPSAVRLTGWADGAQRRHPATAARHVRASGCRDRRRRPPGRGGARLPGAARCRPAVVRHRHRRCRRGTDAHYRPVRRPLQQALSDMGTSLDQIDLVVNCHLHFDHCGGNPLLAGRPVFAQRTELELARSPGHTFPELVDFAGVTYRELDGETEILPGVHVLPTPGHTAGHQSLAVECDDGTVVLAGQSHDYASDHTAADLARRAHAARGGAAAADVPAVVGPRRRPGPPPGGVRARPGGLGAGRLSPLTAGVLVHPLAPCRSTRRPVARRPPTRRPVGRSTPVVAATR